ncbi:hypothetical protein KC19_3G174400 [Ceratodon purpureus]|uniref:E3 SUMO-protein ligase SIZ1 n=1 Tax=Ceratodon purpureus TaxID=3225 RepID=A0A8T0IJK8_CERPU|nr:hypothetical protein KC19_3G174400 [Ceratodon purpureus]
MADVASRCRSQLGSFRIRELKDVLARLGLPKQGKKQILMDKIMGLINPPDKQLLMKGPKSSKRVVSREEAIAIIDEQYRKLRTSGTDFSKHKSAKSGSSSGYPSAGPEEHRVCDETKTRCPCGSTVDTGTMIQCDDPKCRIWQHMSCVVIPEKPLDGVSAEIPSNFYCELCRIARGDPFSVAVSQTLWPSKLVSSTAKTDGANTLQSIEKSFYLSRVDRDLLQKPNYDLQVWCVLLSDKVSFRIHWPSYADLRVNGISVRVTNRPGQQLLGANGRDEGPGITVCTREGLNRLNMSAYDARPFCLGVRIIRRLSLEQVMEMIPSEKDGEPFEDAMARVRRCINGSGGQGLGGDDDGSDSDLEVVAESITVNLRCPMSGSRIKVAGRFKPCLHMGCFDFNTYVELNQRARKWQCPICLKNYSIEHLIIDPFFNRITNAVKNLDEDITEVELKADGSWRPKLEGSARLGEPWRPSPAAAGTVLTNGIKPVPVLFNNHVKVEEGLSSHEHGSLRFKRTPEGHWALNGMKHGLIGGPSQQVTTIPRGSRSSSATDSNLKGEGDEDEHSVNQDPSEKNGISIDDNDEAEFSSRQRDAPPGMWQTSGDDPTNGADVIVLSDTDDEGPEEEAVVGSSGASMYAESDVVGNGRMRSSEISVPNDANGDSSGLALGLESVDVTLGSNSGCLPFDPLLSTRVGIGVPDEGTSNSSGLGLQLDSNRFWATESARNGHYRYYGSQADAGMLQHPPPVRPTPVQAVAGSGFLSTSLIRDDSLQSGWKSYRPSTSVPFGAIDGGSMDSDTRASPLQNFLTDQPARAEVQENSREPLLTEGDIDNSWFSLSLGGGENFVEPTPTRSLRTSPVEPRSPIPQPRVAEIDTHSRGLGSNGSSQRLMDSRPPVRSHFTADGHPFPVRPRSSPMHARRVYRQVRMDDSE